MPQTTEVESSPALPVVLWHPDGRRVLLKDGTLPVLHVPQGGDLDALIRATWGIATWTLHDGGLMLGREGTAQVQALLDTTPEGFTWGKAEVGPPSGAREWQRPGWPGKAREVLDHCLARAGLTRTEDPEPVHSNDLVAVVRTETDGGTVYLKASDTPREAAVTALLSRTLPDLLPPLLWSTPQRGLLVSASGGELLDGVAGLDAWEQIMGRLAQFQRKADPVALAGLGCPAWPLDEMTDRVDALLADAETLLYLGTGRGPHQGVGDSPTDCPRCLRGTGITRPS